MKKITSLLMAGLLSLGLAACDGNNTQSQEESKTEVEELVFNVVEDNLTFNQLGEYKVLTAKYGEETVTNVNYEAVDKSIVDIVNGVVIAKNAGRTNIAASYVVNGKTYDDVCMVKVNSEFKTRFNVEGKVFNLRSGETLQTGATVTYPTTYYEDLGVEFSSDNEAVATVNKKTGEVTAVNQGIANIKASSVVQITTQVAAMGMVMTSTSAAEAEITVIVDNEFEKTANKELIGVYSNHYDWQGFAKDLKKTDKEPAWTKENLIWIRAMSNLTLKEDGTFVQQVLNAQRFGYFIDEAKLADPTTKYDTYEDQIAVFKKCYVYNKYAQKAEVIDGKQFGEIKGMLDLGMPNFSEKGAFAIFGGKLVLSYEGQVAELGVVNNNEWLETPYKPFTNMVKMHANMTMKLVKGA